MSTAREYLAEHGWVPLAIHDVLKENGGALVAFPGRG
jgi:hypothetical protein